MRETVDAAELKRMNQENEITGCIVEGPISADIAMSPNAVSRKEFDNVNPVAGDADVLLFPNIAAANILVKAMGLFANAIPVGMVLGAEVPISVSSRSASAKDKYYSLSVTSAVVTVRKL